MRGRQDVLEHRGEIRPRATALFQRAPGGPTQGNESFDLWPAESAIEQRRNGGQQIPHGILHAADMRLRCGIAVAREATGQFRLRQGAVAFLFILFIQLAGFFYRECTLDEGQAAVQFVFGEMAGERDDLAAWRPRTEQESDGKNRSSRISVP